MTLLQRIPALLLLTLAACDAAESDPGDDPGAPIPGAPVLGAAICSVIVDEVIPASFGWETSLAVDAAGVVHIGSSTQHATRALDGTWAVQEPGFDTLYAASPLLEPGPQGLVVAHGGEGVRVARAQEGSWLSLFDRPREQCSGNPYVEDLEVGADGRILAHTSEGPLLFTPGGAAEEIGALGQRLALDDVGTLELRGGEPLVIVDRFGEHTMAGHGAYVHDVGTSARGEVAVIVGGGEEPGVVAHLREGDGTWSQQPIELVHWTVVDCEDDPSAGQRCTGTHTNIESATVHVAPGADALVVSVVLRDTAFDLEWNRWPAAGGVGSYWGWEGDRIDRHRVVIGTLRDGALHMLPVAVPEPGEDEPAPRVAIDARGDRHILVGSRYLRTSCGG